MRASEFDYQLPRELIAQQPAPRRDEARLYVLPRREGPSAHAVIADLPAWLPRGALLVVNDTRVFPARLRGHKATGGRVELLLLERIGEATVAAGWRETWACLAGASKPLRPGMAIRIEGEDVPRAEILAVHGAEVEAAFVGEGAGGMLAVAERLGEVPLPPYIERQEPPGAGDRERYQTVYARIPGAAAAPTAGLHFTPELLARLDAAGIERTALTLHVGLGTFAPLRSDDLDGIDRLHLEHFVIPEATARAIARARRGRRPVVAVGTTTVRALESACDDDGHLRPGAGETSLFIRPGHRFRIVDGLLTNFHLPRSTLLMLVAAFTSRERILAAYTDAVARGYRFFSYGDAMLILDGFSPANQP